MAYSIFCYIDFTKDQPQLRMETPYHNIPALAKWSDKLLIVDYPIFIDQCLNEKDFAPVEGTHCRFWFGELGGTKYPDGYVSIEYSGEKEAIIPILALWGLLMTISKELLNAVDQFQEIPSLQTAGSALESIPKLVEKIKAKINRDSIQGELIFKSIDRFGLNGDHSATASFLESYSNWMPFVNLNQLVDIIHFDAVELFLRRVRVPRTSINVPVPQTIQAQFVEDLKLARVWGKRIPAEFLTTDNRVLSMIECYHQLLDYCRLTNPSTEEKADLSIEMDQLPFAVDWFRNLLEKLNKSFDPIAFTMQAQRVWNDYPSIIPEVREILFEGWIFRIRVVHVAVSRLGFLDIVFVYEEEEEENDDSNH